MKGVGWAIKIAMMFILVLFVILIYFYFLVPYVLGYFQPKIEAESYITQLCLEWVNNGCTRFSAKEIQIKVGDETKTLAQLCVIHFDGDESIWETEWEKTNPNYHDKCKKICIGCP